MINTLAYKTKKETACKKSIALFVAFYLISFCSFAQGNFTLISNSKSDYHIVLSQKASAVETEAANILQSYLSKISGCTLPITNEAINANAKQVIIGNTNVLQRSDTSGLGADGILIKRSRSAVIFAGGYRKGVLYSVYTFLDSILGCKMYTQDVSQIPQNKTVTIPANLNIKQVPAFDYRMSGFINLSKAYCDFNKQNFYLESWGLWVHSFKELVPENKYFTTHPEYFSLVDGKRTPKQLCLSNPEVLKVLVDNLAMLMKAKPDAKYWSVSQNDNQFYCQCDNCKKLDAEQGSHAASVINFVNKVAANFPDKIISTLAYQYSQKPPKSIKPAANVMIMLTSLNEQRDKPISTSKSDFNTDLNNWLTLTHQLFVWDYIVQYTNSMSPFPNLYTLQPNIQYFNSKDVRYLFEEGFVNQPSEFSELRTYLISKLMWNANTDVNKTMHQFIEAFYGNASAPYIEQYIQQLHSDLVKTGARLFIFGSPADQRNTYLTLDNIQKYKAIFQKALAPLDKNGAYYKRVLKEYLSVLFAEIDVSQAIMTVKKTNSAADKAKFASQLKDFIEKAKQADIKYVNEGLRKVDDYYNEQIKKAE